MNTQSNTFVGTGRPPFLDNKGPIRALWPHIIVKHDELRAAIKRWLTESRLPGSSEKQRFAMLRADELLAVAGKNQKKDVEWFFSRMEESIDAIIRNNVV